MDLLKEKFLAIYANTPLSVRDTTVLVIEDGGIKKPLSWNVAYLEVKSDTPLSKQILENLKELEII